MPRATASFFDLRNLAIKVSHINGISRHKKEKRDNDHKKIKNLPHDTALLLLDV